MVFLMTMVLHSLGMMIDTDMTSLVFGDRRDCLDIHRYPWHGGKSVSFELEIFFGGGIYLFPLTRCRRQL